MEMGIRKRSVDPDSPQSNRGRFPKGWRMSPAPVTRSPSSVVSQKAPRACMQRRVASMSWEKARFLMVLEPAARAAARIQRWARDLLGGGVTTPERRRGVI